MINMLIIAAVILVAIIFIGVVITRLYVRSTKELAFVRTGLGGQKVIMDGGAIVLPVVHETVPVNMSTLRLEVVRAQKDALITRDRLRVDVTAEFFVRVKPTEESIAKAAQTLGKRTLNPQQLNELIIGKFVDSLRSVAAAMDMEELHEKRVDFVQKVQQAVSEDLSKNGLELESVSLTGLDQTDFKFFNPQNAFDAEGLTKLTETIEDRRKRRNDIEKSAEVAVAQRNLEAEQQSLSIERETEYARMEQEREVAIRTAEQKTEIAKQQAERKREAEEAEIASEREVELKRIAAARDIQNQNIQKEQSIQTSSIEQEKAIELAEQDKAIAVAQKSQAESEAKALADKARAEAVKAEEEVITVRETQRAERQKAVELVSAKEKAEKDAIAITVAAEAEKKASSDRAEAITIAAKAEADAVTIAAKAKAEQESLSITIVAEAHKTAAQAKADSITIQAEADAKATMLKADALERQYAVDAEGKQKINEAANILSDDQRAMEVKLALIEALPSIISESVKPMEKIDGIKILQVNGLTSMGSGATVVEGDASAASLSDQVVNSALRYRSQAPLIDSLMGELGIKGGDINSMTESVSSVKS